VYHYHPRKAPDPSLWLSIDEQERIRLIESFHRSERQRLPNITAHSAFHAIVENQIAENLDAVVRAMERLQKQGLTRHDAVHAVSWVLAMQLYEAANASSKSEGNSAEMQANYVAAIERLDAKTWKEQASTPSDG
jgi:hypothetical protein